MTADLPTRARVSIAIPCYEMGGRGAECLDVALTSIESQTYRDLEVVVADHSVDDEIEQLCARWSDRLDLRYARNTKDRGSSSANANFALQHAGGELVKILCQDDFLAGPDAIEQTAAAFAPSSAWLVSAYSFTADRGSAGETYHPRLNADIHLVNTIGTHSCLTIRRVERLELFDERLIWFMDCEYYRRLYDRFGEPVVLDDVTVVQLVWPGQVTNTLASTAALRRAEERLVRQAHPTPIPGMPRAERRLVRRLRAAGRRG
jgi:glycosyltransferase involved in cell wall biosynthesis